MENIIVDSIENLNIVLDKLYIINDIKKAIIGSRYTINITNAYASV